MFYWNGKRKYLVNFSKTWGWSGNKETNKSKKENVTGNIEWPSKLRMISVWGGDNETTGREQ